MSRIEQYWCDQQILVTVHDGERAETITVDKPFALLGSSKKCDVTLDDTRVRSRHVYLHATEQGVYCLPLSEAVEGISPRWLAPDEFFPCGQFRVQVRTEGPAISDPVPIAQRSDLGSYGSAPSPIPELTITRGEKKIADRRARAIVTMVGRARPSLLRIPSSSLSRCHCALYWRDGNLWVIDLLSTNHTYIDGKRVNSSAIALGASLKLGEFQVRFSGFLETKVPAEKWKRSKKSKSGRQDDDHVLDDFVSAESPADSSPSRAGLDDSGIALRPLTRIPPSTDESQDHEPEVSPDAADDSDANLDVSSPVTPLDPPDSGPARGDEPVSVSEATVKDDARNDQLASAAAFAKVEQLESANHELTSQLAQSEHALKIAQTDIDELRTSIEQLTSDVRSREEKYETKSEQTDTVQAELAAIKASKEELEKEIVQAKKSLQDVEAVCVKIEEERAVHEAASQSATEELESLRVELAAANARHEQTLAEALEAATQEREKALAGSEATWNQAREELEARLDEADQQSDELKKEREFRLRLEKQLEVSESSQGAARQSIDEVSRQLDEDRAERDRLVAAHQSAVMKLEEEMTTLRDERDRLLAENETHVRDKATATTQLRESADKLEADLASALKQLDAKTEKHDELVQELDSAQAALLQAQSEVDQGRKLQEQAASTEEELARLKTECDALHAQVESAQQQILEKDETARQLATQHASERAERESELKSQFEQELLEHLASAESEREALREQLAALESQRTASTESIAQDLADAQAKLVEEQESRQQEQRRFEDELRSLTEQLTTAQSDYQDSESRRLDIEQKIPDFEAVQSERDLLRQQLDELRAHLESSSAEQQARFAAQLEEMESAKRERERESVDQADRIAQLESEASELRAKIAEQDSVHEELARQSKTNSEMDARVASLQSIVDQQPALGEEIARLQGALEEQSRQREAAEASLAECEAEWSQKHQKTVNDLSTRNEQFVNATARWETEKHKLHRKVSSLKEENKLLDEAILNLQRSRADNSVATIDSAPHHGTDVMDVDALTAASDMASSTEQTTDEHKRTFDLSPPAPAYDDEFESGEDYADIEVLDEVAASLSEFGHSKKRAQSRRGMTAFFVSMWILGVVLAGSLIVIVIMAVIKNMSESAA